MPGDNWDGAITSLLSEVQSILDSDKGSLGPDGVEQVTIGEKRRGWNERTMEVMLAPQGADVGGDGKRARAHDVTTRVLVQTRMRDAQGHRDGDVLATLEQAADQLRAKPSANGEARTCTVNAFRVLGLGENEQGGRAGRFETVGILEIDYQHTVQDRDA